VRVDDQWRAGALVQEPDLILERQVIEQADAEDEVEATEVGHSDVFGHPSDPWVLGPVATTSVCRRDPPTSISSKPREPTITGPQVDQETGSELLE